MPLMDDLMHALGSDGVGTLGRSLGLDSQTTSKALSAAVPLLMASLTRNASNSDGAASLASAIDRDHDGSVLDDLSGYLSRAGADGDGERILAHAFGGRTDAAARTVGGASGIDTAKAMHLLAMAAPLVLGAIGRAKQQGHIQQGQIAPYLDSETHALRQRSSGAMDMISKVLDADHDGSVFDELAEMGTQLFSAFESGRA